MLQSNKVLAIARDCSAGRSEEAGLEESFVLLIRFLAEFPDQLSWRGGLRPSASTQSGVEAIAEKFFSAYRKPDVPAGPTTVPDAMVDVVMQEVYGYSLQHCAKISVTHQHAMSAENCVGALLERYIDSVLRPHGWGWCCGSLVRAVDFIYRRPDGRWIALQIKNRDNSENSSSSAIRAGTEIQKWFRTFSRTGKTNWDRLPESMQGRGLCETGFVDFVQAYLRRNRTPMR